MVIKKIRIINFQAHRKLDLDLIEFVAITGISSSGKTAIMRALEWLLYGAWDSTYPNDTNLETSVIVQLSNGTIIGRFRKGDKNRAVIRLPGEKAVPYEDFGAVIPGIYDIINVREIQAGTRSVNLNFSRQEDPVFMVSDTWTGPAKAAWLGRLYGAHIITAMLRMMASDKREHEATRKRLDAEAAALVLSLDAYGDTAAQHAAITEARSNVEQLASLEAVTAEISNILDKKRIIAESKAILAVDFTGLKDDAVRLQDLLAADSDRATAAREAWLASAKDCLLKANLGALRADSERLALLLSIESEMTVITSLSSLVHRLEVIKAVDLDAIKADMSRLSILEEAHREDQAVSRLGLRLVRDAGSVHAKLHELKTGLKADVLLDGKCPVCRSKPSKANADSLADNLKIVLGV